MVVIVAENAIHLVILIVLLLVKVIVSLHVQEIVVEVVEEAVHLDVEVGAKVIANQHAQLLVLVDVKVDAQEAVQVVKTNVLDHALLDVFLAVQETVDLVVRQLVIKLVQKDATIHVPMLALMRAAQHVVVLVVVPVFQVALQHVEITVKVLAMGVVQVAALNVVEHVVLHVLESVMHHAKKIVVMDVRVHVQQAVGKHVK